MMFDKKNLFAIQLFLFFLLAACNGNESGNSSTTETPKLPIQCDFTPPNPDAYKRVTVLFDLSGSVGTSAITKIASEVSDIIAKMPNDTDINVFGTEDNVYAQPIFSFYKKSPTNPALKATFINQTIPCIQEKAKQEIVNAYNEPTKNSCIINSFKAIYNNKNISLTKPEKNYLIIFSDLMECCANGCPQSREDFLDLKNSLSKYNLSGFQFSEHISLTNIHLMIASTNSDNKIRKSQDSLEFKAFWNAVFQQFGYSEDIEKNMTSSTNAFLQNL